MTCDAVLNTIELIAAGDLPLDAATTAHLAGCPSCPAALAAARRLEALLRERPVVAPPAQFTERTMARIRRARWRNEQMIDWGFNAVMGAVALALAAAVWIVASRSGLSFVPSDTSELLASNMRSLVERVTPSLPLYALAAALVATALGVWWWAERDAPI